MKIFTTILIILVSNFASSQKCDTLKFTSPFLPSDFPDEVNCLDSLGRKQEWWINFRTRQYDLQSPLSGQPSAIAEVVEDYSYGKYFNDKKIGKWQYAISGCANYIVKTENYFEDGSHEVISNGSRVRYNSDSSEIECKVEIDPDSVTILCKESNLIMACSAIYRGNVIKQFPFKDLEFEIDRLKMFQNKIRKGNSH